MEEKVENVKVEKPKKTKSKKKIFGVIAGVVSVVVAGSIIGAAILGNTPDYGKYETLKTQTEITRDIGTFKTDDDYFIQGEKGIYRFFKEKDKNIVVVVADDVDQRYYDGYEKSVEFLNNTFDVINNKYEWEITRASDLNGKKAHVYVKNGELSGESQMECSSLVKTRQDLITSSTITIDDADADKLPDAMVNVACLHEMMHTLGLQDMYTQNYYGRTIMYPYATYTTQLKLLPYDARNLISAYADINTPERLEELKKFTIDTKYVANTHNYQDLDMDYGNSLDW